MGRLPENTAKVTEQEREALLDDIDFISVAKVDDWSVEEKEHFIQKGFRAPREDEVPRITNIIRPTDYEHDLKRGTVNYHKDLRNYSFCAVNIPDGTILRSCNFYQSQPGTPAINGQNITLIECNLTNVLIDPSWTLDRCNTAQTWLLENGKRQYICGHSDELPQILDKPVNALTERDF